MESVAQPQLQPIRQPGRAASVQPAQPGFSDKLKKASASAPSAPSPQQTGTVRATATPITGDQAADALVEAYEKKFGEPPTRNAIAVLTAQWAHETGSGASMYNFNFGGIKGTSPDGLSAAYRTREGWGSSEVQIVDKFRAYTTAASGAEDYLGLLERKYPEALRAAQEGDPVAFVRNLKSGGYFTGNEEQYVRSVSRMTDKALEGGPGALTAWGVSPGETSMRFQSLELAPPRATPNYLNFNSRGGMPGELAGGLYALDRGGFSVDALRADGLSAGRISSAADEVARSAFRILIGAHEREVEDRSNTNRDVTAGNRARAGGMESRRG